MSHTQFEETLKEAFEALRTHKTFTGKKDLTWQEFQEETRTDKQIDETFDRARDYILEQMCDMYAPYHTLAAALGKIRKPMRETNPWLNSVAPYRAFMEGQQSTNIQSELLAAELIKAAVCPRTEEQLFSTAEQEYAELRLGWHRRQLLISLALTEDPATLTDTIDQCETQQTPYRDVVRHKLQSVPWELTQKHRELEEYLSTLQKAFEQYKEYIGAQNLTLHRRPDTTVDIISNYFLQRDAFIAESDRSIIYKRGDGTTIESEFENAWFEDVVGIAERINTNYLAHALYNAHENMQLAMQGLAIAFGAVQRAPEDPTVAEFEIFYDILRCDERFKMAEIAYRPT